MLPSDLPIAAMRSRRADNAHEIMLGGLTLGRRMILLTVRTDKGCAATLVDKRSEISVEADEISALW